MTEQITLIFAENLRNHRRAEGLNRAELARRAGLSAGYVRFLELAARSPRIEAVEALALALEIDTAFLLTAQQTKNPPSRS
jgi:transcriptional regulator with XRE-family HTH domain